MPVPVGAWPNKVFPISLSKNGEISPPKDTGTWEFEPKVGRVVACLAMSCHATRKFLPGLSCAPLLFRRLFLFCALFLRSLFRSLFLSRSCSLSSKEEESACTPFLMKLSPSSSSSSSAAMLTSCIDHGVLWLLLPE